MARPLPVEKRCPRCGVVYRLFDDTGELLPDAELGFSRISSKNARGWELKRWCKACNLVTQRERRQTIIAEGGERAIQLKARQRAADQRYYQEHKGQRNETIKKWRKANPKRTAAWYRAWLERNPDQRRGSQRAYRARKQEQRGARAGPVVNPQIIAELNERDRDLQRDE